MTNRSRRHVLAVGATIALLAASCGDSESESSATTTPPETTEATPATTEATPETTEATTTTSTTTSTTVPAATTTTAPATTVAPTTVAPTTSTPVRGEILESFVGAVATPYPAGPAVDDEVRVYFNNGTDGTIVAIYHGPGLSDPTGLCPGNSLAADGAFQFISNAPVSDGACEGFPTEVGSVRVCTSNVWLYKTLIPNDSEGDLYGSLERLVDGTYFGATAVATNQPGTPEIDYNADVYTISPMFTSDDATEITCADPLT